MKLKNFSIAFEIANNLGFNTLRAYLGILTYYIFTIVNALLEGIGLIIVVDLFTGAAINDNYNSSIVAIIKDYLSFFDINLNINLLLLIVCFLFLMRILTYSSILISEGYFHAVVRRSIQSFIFKNYISGKWDFIRNVRVGHAVNILNLEAMHLEKYYFSFFKGVYFFMTSTLLIVLAMIINFNITLILTVVSIPFLFALYFLLKIQTRLSEKFANLRNLFGADISERISGLMQIQVENTQNYHLKAGLRTQPDMQRLEILIGICQASLSLFAIVLPFVIFGIIFLISFLTKIDVSLFLTSLAIIGVIGVRAITQLNGLVGSIGTISRFEGSLLVIKEALKIPNVRERRKINEEIDSINCTNLSYEYSGNKILKDINFSIKKGETFILQGRSGSGKTTLANLLAGIIDPLTGRIEYISKNKKYDSKLFRANIGYVMQDIYTFKGTVRENLISGDDISDQEIWNTLKKVQAEEFIKKIGGLDCELLEAGRSLSGGQKRRLGIARALLKKADIIILDEITSGLDEINIEAIKKLIQDLSDEKLVIMISHDHIHLDKSVIYEI